MWANRHGATKMSCSRFPLMAFGLLFFVGGSQHVVAFNPLPKDALLADIFLSDLLSHIDKDLEQSSSNNNNYYDLDGIDLPKNLDMVSRSSAVNGGGGSVSSLKNSPSGVEEFEYRKMFAGDEPIVSGSRNPSLRDREYLKPALQPLWGHQYMSGGMGELNRYNTIKTDASLPAYCNPPNPCPYSYDDSQGCISDFDNTAIFSREYQAGQDCTCDNEHMFDCGADQDDNSNTNEMTSTMEKFLMHQFQNENGIESDGGGGGGPSAAVVKKTFPMSMHRDRDSHNPFLQGEKLPIAAKKGARL